MSTNYFGTARRDLDSIESSIEDARMELESAIDHVNILHQSLNQAEKSSGWKLDESEANRYAFVLRELASILENK